MVGIMALMAHIAELRDLKYSVDDLCREIGTTDSRSPE